MCIRDSLDTVQRDLLPDIKNAFNAKRTFRKAVNGIRMINRLRSETIEHQSARQEMEQQHRLAEEESSNLDRVWQAEAARSGTTSWAHLVVEIRHM